MDRSLDETIAERQVRIHGKWLKKRITDMTRSAQAIVTADSHRAGTTIHETESERSVRQC